MGEGHVGEGHLGEEHERGGCFYPVTLSPSILRLFHPLWLIFHFQQTQPEPFSIIGKLIVLGVRQVVTVMDHLPQSCGPLPAAMNIITPYSIHVHHTLFTGLLQYQR